MAPVVSFRTQSPRKVVLGGNTRILLASPAARNVSWKLNGRLISDSDANVKQSSVAGGIFVLDLLSVTHEHVGSVEAELIDENGELTSEQFTVDLYDSAALPEASCCNLIRGLPSHLQLTRGEDATLRTRFLAKPNASFTWLQNGLPVLSSEDSAEDSGPPIHRDMKTSTMDDTTELALFGVGARTTVGRLHLCAVLDNGYGCDYRPVELLIWDAHEKVCIESLEKFAAQYTLEENIIGTGRFGTVYLCIDKSTTKKAAAKIIKAVTSKERAAVEREVDVLNRFRGHPKLLTLLGVYRGPKEMILVTECVTGGELFERVVAEDFCLTEYDCTEFLRQILDALDYVHSQNVLHLDLKPENILCTDTKGYNIKIIDFGLAQHYDPSEDLRILFGTPEFVAPEVISYEPVSPKSDMWSIGVITYVLLSGLSPFMGDTDDETFQNVINVDYEFDVDAFEDISSTAMTFIERLLVRDPSARPSCEECLADPWLRTDSSDPRRVLIDTQKLKSFVVRRKWLKGANVIYALNRLGVLTARANLAKQPRVQLATELTGNEGTSE